MSGAPVLVIGAGIGGLTSAIALAARGIDVMVIERAAQPGGKMREVQVAGRAMDAGPTVFTMRWVFEELFADAGAKLSEQLSLHPVPTLARHAWNADATLDLHADIERSVDAIARFAGPDEGRRYRSFCKRAAGICDTLETPFLRGSRPTPWSLTARVGLRGLPGLARISPFATLWSSLGAYFRDPRLRQLFGRYATYCGSSPYLAPATLMLVAHVEREGVWRVEGGMQRIATALAALATRLGVRFRFDTPVQEIVIRDDRARGVRLASGETLAADAVVFNGDVAALAQGLLGGGVARAVAPMHRAQPSLSAITWNVVARTSGFPLLHHSVFFGSDCASEFDAIFDHGHPPTDPTVYVCAQDRGGPDAAPIDGAERLLCLINAPAAAAITPEELDRCEQHMLQRLARCGLTLDTGSSAMVRTTPQDFARMFPGSAGALYGRASHGWMASFRRPGARSRIRGLYLAGGTTHPGPGVPMAALSGRQAAQSLLEDRGRASMPWSRPVAMPGGISTR